MSVGREIRPRRVANPRAAQAFLAVALWLRTAHPAPDVVAIRAPDNGIQPQAAVDASGAVHLLYYRGEPQAGDLYYTVSRDGGAAFSPATRVNSQPGSALAMGNIRGGQLAIGAGDSIHVAWMGSKTAGPPAPGGARPFLYSRLIAEKTAFEPQRNLIQARPGLDGGGSIAADSAGHVFAVWHAPGGTAHSESDRRIWLAASSDNGKTFATEEAVNPDPTGVCACCGMKALASARGELFVFYRSAREMFHRDMILLGAAGGKGPFSGAVADPWYIGQCPMSSCSFANAPEGPIAAWETAKQVFYSGFDPKTAHLKGKPIAPPGDTKDRKYPSLAVNSNGDTLLAWTEGMAFGRGGALAWQVFDKNGSPIGASGRVSSAVPPWSLVAAVARSNGDFAVIH